MDRDSSEYQLSLEPVCRADGHGSESGGTLIGLTTKDGVVMAADTRTSRGRVVRSERVQKISEVHRSAALGSTGDLGAVRSLVRAITSEADRYETSHGEPMDMTALSTVVATELRERSGPDATFLLGGLDDDGSHVFILGQQGSALDETHAAVGSGRRLAYGMLDAEDLQSLTMVEARRLAGRAIQRAAERDIQTGVGVQVAEISEDGVDINRYDSVEELS